MQTHGRRGRRGFALATVVVALALALHPSAPGRADTQRPPTYEAPTEFDFSGNVAADEQWTALRPDRNRGGLVPVIVGLRMTYVTPGRLDKRARDEQRGAIESVRTDLLSALDGTTHRTARALGELPFVALELDTDAVDRLRRSGLAASIRQDLAAKPDLATSVPQVEADEAHHFGWDGSGHTIAIIDTGVDGSHPQLAGKIVGELCFSAGSNCPNGSTYDVGAGAGVDCGNAAGCDHGTHVAGIAAGDGGVAPAATIVSIRVASIVSGSDCAPGPSPCATNYLSDILMGLQAVIESSNNPFNYAAVNLSLGSWDPPSCDPASETGVAMSALHSLGIAPVVSAGNDSMSSGLGFPACLPQAVSVGAVDVIDNVAMFSNSSNALWFWAPGVSINSSVPGGGTAAKWGTSMAAPHVAGAIAAIRDRFPAASLGDVFTGLIAGGKPVTDPRNNVTKPRLRLLTALVEMQDSGFEYQQLTPPPGYRFGTTSAGVGLEGTGSGTLGVTSVPPGAVVWAAELFWQTVGRGKASPASTTPSTIPTAGLKWNGSPVSGTLVGAADAPCHALSDSAVRTYRADVTSKVSGNGSAALTDAGANALGASVLVVYKLPQNGQETFVNVVYGAQSAVMFDAMTAGMEYIDGAGSGSLHLGVGDGSKATEEPVTLAGADVMPADYFPASAGAAWDDRIAPVAGKLFPDAVPGPHGWAQTKIRTKTECLTWAYAALQSSKTLDQVGVPTPTPGP